MSGGPTWHMLPQSARREDDGEERGHAERVELATILQERCRNIKVAVVNNGYLGMVRQWQELFEDKRYSGTLLSGPDFARLADAYGMRGFTIVEPHEVDAAIAAAWDHDGPVVLDFRVEREVNVFPIVPAGKGLDEMLVAGGSPA